MKILNLSGFLILKNYVFVYYYHNALGKQPWFLLILKPVIQFWEAKSTKPGYNKVLTINGKLWLKVTSINRYKFLK